MQEKVTLVNPLCFLSDKVVWVDLQDLGIGMGVAGREGELGCSSYTTAMAIAPLGETPQQREDNIRKLKEALEEKLKNGVPA